MRISCPDCAAAYDVPDAMLSAGREVRCARCGRSWAPAAAAPLPAPTPLPAAAAAAVPVPPSAPPVTFPEPAPPGPAEPPRAPPVPAEPFPPEDAEAPVPSATAGEEGGRTLVLAWIGSLVLLALGATGLVSFHEQIAEAWPPAIRLFRVLGLS